MFSWAIIFLRVVTQRPETYSSVLILSRGNQSHSARSFWLFERVKTVSGCLLLLLSHSSISDDTMEASSQKDNRSCVAHH